MNSPINGAQPWRSRFAALCWTGMSLGLVVYSLLALDITFLEPRLLARSFEPVNALADGSTPLNVVWTMWLGWAASLMAIYRLLRVPAQSVVVVTVPRD